ncbi:MAG TPA: FG-GAP-like repeat-containing protein, partial [Archangium sp.]
MSNSSIANCGTTSCNPCSPPLNAVATCNGVSCDFQCNFGYHRCGSSCVADTSVDGCGSSCTPCAAGPANSTRTCSGGGTCGWTCNSGFHACNGQCVSDSSVTQCGASCTACTAPANGSSVCSSGACDFVCNAGYHRCGNQCLSNTDVNSCGTSCTPCSSSVPANSTAACNGTSCTFTCNGGFFACNGECVPADFVSACGASCTACTSSGSFDKPTCSNGACGTSCITSCNSACVDVNRDPSNCGTCGTTCAGGETCTSGQCRASCGTGVGFGDVVPFLNVNPPSAQYRLLAEDVNGDGRVDLIDNAPASGLRLLLGNADGTFQAPTTISSSSFSSKAIGFTLVDLNGDGRKDLVAVRGGATTNILIANGNGTGFNTPTVTQVSTSTYIPSGAIAVADFNGDTRPDLMIPVTSTYNFFLMQTASATWPTGYTHYASVPLANATFADVGDFDKNGRVDVVLATSAQYQVAMRTATTWPASGDVGTAFTVTTVSASGIAGVKTADVNADTNVDALIRTSGNVVYLQGTGTTAPTAQTPITLGGTGGLAVADLNGDGFLDLAGGSTGSITVALASA